MNKKAATPILIFLLGIITGAIYYFSMANDYEGEKLLLKNGTILGLPLYTFIVLFFVLCAIAFCAYFAFNTKEIVPKNYLELCKSNSIYVPVLNYISIFALALIVFYEILNFTETGLYSSLILGVFTLFVVLILFFITTLVNKGKYNETYGMLTAVPVLWACFWLIIVFKDYTSDPIRMHYVFYLFAVVCTILALFYIAGFAYNVIKVKFTLFFTLCAMFLCTVTATALGAYFLSHQALPFRYTPSAAFFCLFGGVYFLIKSVTMLFAPIKPAEIQNPFE